MYISSCIKDHTISKQYSSRKRNMKWILGVMPKHIRSTNEGSFSDWFVRAGLKIIIFLEPIVKFFCDTQNHEIYYIQVVKIIVALKNIFLIGKISLDLILLLKGTRLIFSEILAKSWTSDRLLSFVITFVTFRKNC